MKGTSRWLAALVVASFVGAGCERLPWESGQGGAPAEQSPVPSSVAVPGAGGAGGAAAEEAGSPGSGAGVVTGGGAGEQGGEAGSVTGAGAGEEGGEAGSVAGSGETAAKGVVELVGGAMLDPLLEQARRPYYYGLLMPYATVTLSAEVSGRLILVEKKKGDVVHSGEKLFSIDPVLLDLAHRQAQQAFKQAQLKVETLGQALEVERKSLQAALAQADAGLEAARAQQDLVEHGATREEKQQVAAAARGANVGLDGARRELDRLESLFKDNAATQQQLDLARTAYKAASAQYDQARSAYQLTLRGSRDENKEAAKAGVRRAEAARDAALAAIEGLKIREKELEMARVAVVQAELAVENARVMKEKSTLSVPEGGRFQVATLYVDQGEIVGPGIRLVDLVRLDRPYVALQLPGAEVAGIQVGSEMRVWCVGDPDGRWRRGTVSHIPALANQMNAKFLVEVELAGTEGLPKVGQLCRVEAPK